MSQAAAINPRHIIIRWLTPVIWRLFPARKISTLQEFSTVERDSGGQLLCCIPLVSDPRLKAAIFQHVLEEVFHGEIFEELCQSFSERPLPTPVKPREDLVSPNPGADEVLRFFSYVHVGEQAVNRDFLQYAHAALDKKSRAVFMRAGSDEGQHEGDTGDILLDLVKGDRRRYRRYIWMARAKRAWLLYKGTMSRVGEFMLGVMLTAVYLAGGLAATRSSRRRLKMPAAEQAELMRRQVADFERQMR
jgi:hypothetical protein